MRVITIGVDLAKSVFQAHGVDAAGEVVVAKRLKRSQAAAKTGSSGLGSAISRRLMEAAFGPLEG